MTYKYSSFTNHPRHVRCIPNQKEHNFKESRLMLFSMEKNAHLALPLSALPHQFGINIIIYNFTNKLHFANIFSAVTFNKAYAIFFSVQYKTHCGLTLQYHV